MNNNQLKQANLISITWMPRSLKYSSVGSLAASVSGVLVTVTHVSHTR